MSLQKPLGNVSACRLGVLRAAIGAGLISALLAVTACGRGTPPPVSSPARTPSPQTAPIASSPSEGMHAPPVYQSGGRRDPFRQPRVEAAYKEPMNLKLTGIVWGPRSYYALVESELPPGMGYIIRENDIVDSARVLKITKDTVIFEVKTKSAEGKPLIRYVQKHIRPVESR